MSRLFPCLFVPAIRVACGSGASTRPEPTEISVCFPLLAPGRKMFTSPSLVRPTEIWFEVELFRVADSARASDEAIVLCIAVVVASSRCSLRFEFEFERRLAARGICCPGQNGELGATLG